MRDWFEAFWLISSRDGVSAEALQTALALGSYQTAWVWLHKVRRVMATVAAEPLMGIVELDLISPESVEGGLLPKPTHRPVVGIALEVGGPTVGRVRLASLTNSRPAAVERFIGEAVAPGTTLRTPLKLRAGLVALGYDLDRAAQRAGRDIGLPRLGELARRLDDWFRGTHHGAVRRAHLDFYLAEFAFRFNERGSSHGLRFCRLLERALTVAPTSARAVVGGTGEAAMAAMQPSPPRAKRVTP